MDLQSPPTDFMKNSCESFVKFPFLVNERGNIFNSNIFDFIKCNSSSIDPNDAWLNNLGRPFV